MARMPAREEQWRRLYLGVRGKFLLSLTIAVVWTALSVWLSQRWLVDLAEVTNWPFALIAIVFIAYVPGFMNAFLTPMTDIILSHRGTIDKYMGDAIMAFWNAPLDVERHAALACDTALAMQARIRQLKEATQRQERQIKQLRGRVNALVDRERQRRAAELSLDSDEFPSPLAGEGGA